MHVYQALGLQKERIEAKQGEVLELMAGTGRVSLLLVRAGVHLTCVDNAPELLARFRQKLAQEQLWAQVHEMDVRHLAVDKQFYLILPPFHSFSELVSPPVSIPPFNRPNLPLYPGGLRGKQISLRVRLKHNHHSQGGS